MITRIFLFLTALMFAAFGVWSITDPGGMTSQLGVTIGGESGVFEMRGVVNRGVAARTELLESQIKRVWTNTAPGLELIERVRRVIRVGQLRTKAVVVPSVLVLHGNHVRAKPDLQRRLDRLGQSLANVLSHHDPVNHRVAVVLGLPLQIQRVVAGLLEHVT